MSSAHSSLRRARNVWLLAPFLFTSPVFAQGEAKLAHAPPNALDLKTPAQPPSPATPEPAFARPNASGVVSEARTDTRRVDAGPRTPTIDFTRVYLDAPGNGSIWARGAGYKAKVDERRFTFVPYFGAQAPHNFPVSFELESVAVGSSALAFAQSGTVERHDDRVVIARGNVLETYDFAPEGVEQAFVFRSLPNAGDLTLRMAVASELTARTTDKGIEFTHELGGVRYGHATVLDALGRSLAIASAWTEGAIELRVPAEFLADARFPVTVDPGISVFDVDVSTESDFVPDIAYEDSTGTYLTIWERPFSHTDSDVWAMSKDADGGIVPGSTIPIDITSVNWEHPRVATNGLASQFLVVAATGVPGAPRAISGREREAETPFTQSAQFQISDPATTDDQFDPDVGGDPLRQGPTFYCVVWTRTFSATDTDVLARLVQSNATTSGTPIFLENSSNTNDIHPLISKSDGSAPVPLQDWNIVWERPIPGGVVREYHGAQIHWDGTVTTTPFTVTAQGISLSFPTVSPGFDVQGERDYVIAFASGLGSDRDIVFRVMNTRIVRTLGNLQALETNGFQLQDQTEPSVETDGTSFAIAYGEIDPNDPSDYDIMVSSLIFDGTNLAVVESHASLGSAFSPERHTRMTSARSGGALNSRRYGAVWEDVGFTTFIDIRGGIYESPAEGGITSFCTGDGRPGIDCPCAGSFAGGGCPNSLFTTGALLAATGITSVSNDTLVLRATSTTNATTLYFQGNTAVPPFITGDGITCVGGSIVRLSSKIGVANASQFPAGADLPVSVRGALPAAGGTRYYQCVYRNAAASFCPPGTANRTNALSVTWTP